MSGVKFIIPSIFTAVDQMSPAMRTMSGSLAGFTQKADAFSARSERMFRRLTPVLGEAQKQLLSMVGTGAAVAGIFQLGRSSVNSIMDYETALHSLQAVTGVSDLAMVKFKSEITDLGKVSKKSSIDIAKSFETIGSMMSQYLDDPKALRQIAEAGITLSKASRQELEPTLQNLTSIMNQFGLGADKAAKSINILTAGEIVGSVRTSEVAQYLQEFGASAKNMNVDLAESTALIEALGLQMDKTRIGVGARNLLNIMGAAGGLDKQSRKDLRSAGVDLNFLMNNTNSLSARLHELSKIAKDPIKMVSVFGKENVTAGQVIFNQLGTYDKWVERIKNTNEANHQSAVNSATLRNRITELGNKWTNLITTNEKVGAGVTKITNGIGWLTDNLEGMLSVGVDVIKYYALWKAAMIGVTVVSKSLSIAAGIQSAVLGVSSIALRGNTTALVAQNIALKFVNASTALATGNLTAFNAALGMTPFGWAVIGIAGMAAGLMLLSKREQELIDQYKEKMRLDSVGNIKAEEDALKKLTAQYWSLGLSIREATNMSLRQRNITVSRERFESEQKIKSIKAQLDAEKNKVYFADLFYGGGTPEVGKRSELANQLLTEQSKAKGLADKNLGNVMFGQNQVGNGTINSSDFLNIFKSVSPAKSAYENSSVWGGQMNDAQKSEFTFVFKNESGSSISVKSGKTEVANIMPFVESTKKITK